MRPVLLLICLFGLCATAPPPSATATLLLRVENIRSDHGSLWVGVYTSEEDFLDRERARLLRVPVTATGSTRVAVDDLTPGARYAIAVFHDENDNGELDTNFLGLPAEPYALSRPLRSWFRRPRFDEMSFVFRPREGLSPLRLQ